MDRSLSKSFDDLTINGERDIDDDEEEVEVQ